MKTFTFLLFPLFLSAQSDTLVAEFKIVKTEYGYEVTMSRDTKYTLRELMEILGQFFQEEPEIKKDEKRKTQKI